MFSRDKLWPTYQELMHQSTLKFQFNYSYLLYERLIGKGPAKPMIARCSIAPIIVSVLTSFWFLIGNRPQESTMYTRELDGFYLKKMVGKVL